MKGRNPKIFQWWKSVSDERSCRLDAVHTKMEKEEEKKKTVVKWNNIFGEDGGEPKIQVKREEEEEG